MPNQGHPQVNLISLNKPMGGVHGIHPCMEQPKPLCQWGLELRVQEMPLLEPKWLHWTKVEGAKIVWLPLPSPTNGWNVRSCSDIVHTCMDG